MLQLSLPINAVPLPIEEIRYKDKTLQQWECLAKKWMFLHFLVNLSGASAAAIPCRMVSNISAVHFFGIASELVGYCFVPTALGCVIDAATLQKQIKQSQVIILGTIPENTVRLKCTSLSKLYFALELGNLIITFTTTSYMLASRCDETDLLFFIPFCLGITLLPAALILVCRSFQKLLEAHR